jgi:hypothetical protein
MKKYLLICLVFAGCATFQKQKNRAEKFYKDYPNELASVCADEFPVQVNLVKGKDSIITITNEVVKTVKLPCPDKKDSVDCPSVQVITKYITRIDTLVKVNTAQVDIFRGQSILLAGKNETLTKSIQDKSDQSTKRLYWIIGLALIIAVYSVYKVYCFFSGGFLMNFIKK